MALWQVVAPDKERVVLCEGYIRHELKHGSYVRSEKIVQMFPEFFIRVLDPEEVTVKPEQTYDQLVEDTPKIEQANKEQKEKEKKKAGSKKKDK